MTITLIIIIITTLFSISAFSNEKVMDHLIFYPPAVTHNRQWYRFFTCGLIHADLPHLIFNMYGLYAFGRTVESYFVFIFREKGELLYLLMYVSSLYFCLLPTYSKHKDDRYYRGLGASGAISAIVFSFILIDPLAGMGLIFIPIRLPAFIFGFLYLAASSYMDKRGGDGINHSAHIWGALYGIAFLIASGYLLSDYNVLTEFIEKVRAYISRF